MNQRPEFRVIVAGSQDFYNYELMKEKLNSLLSAKSKTHDITIISGGARGADALGERYATDMMLGLETIPADWDRLGKKAGFERNKEMARTADCLVAFWDGESPGTKNMIDIMNHQKKPVRIVSIV